MISQLLKKNCLFHAACFMKRKPLLGLTWKIAFPEQWFSNHFTVLLHIHTEVAKMKLLKNSIVKELCPNFGTNLKHECTWLLLILTFEAPTTQNSQTYSNNSSAAADELF